MGIKPTFWIGYICLLVGIYIGGLTDWIGGRSQIASCVVQAVFLGFGLYSAWLKRAK